MRARRAHDPEVARVSGGVLRKNPWHCVPGVPTIGVPGPGCQPWDRVKRRIKTLPSSASARRSQSKASHDQIQPPQRRVRKVTHPHRQGCGCPPEGGANRASGPVSTTYDQCGHAAVTRVSGWGHQARAALVDALREANEPEVAREVAGCSSFLLGGSAVTVHQVEGDRRHLGGLNHCGRNLCPICAPYLSARRLEALEPVAARLAADEGLRHFMVVLTLRHRLGAAWRPLVAVLRAMQRRVTAHRRWKGQVEGFVRLLESTFGRNGHHPHEHLLVSIRADEGWDPAEFFAWVQETCEGVARKADRTTEWREGWWSEVPRERLVQATTYLAADAEKQGTLPALYEATSTATKHQPIWAIPAPAFAEVWTASKGMRWFGVGGCWKTTETDATDEALNEEREEVGQVVAHIPGEVWRSWKPQERRDRCAVITDRGVPWRELQEVLQAWGCVLGPPPDPWAAVDQSG